MAFSKPLGALLLPSINNLKGMGEEERMKEPQIQTLFQDLSNQEKQILKQIFISNKIGETVSIVGLLSLLCTVREHWSIFEEIQSVSYRAVR